MGREQTSNSNLVESSATTRGGDGLETPHLPPPPPYKTRKFCFNLVYFFSFTDESCMSTFLIQNYCITNVLYT